MLQKSAGLFQLLAELDFGSAYGVKALYLKSRTANVASVGQIRLARADTIGFRNQANGADLPLGVNTSNQLTFNGEILQLGEITVSDTASINLTLAADDISANIISDSITNAMINSAAAIAYSKLSLTGSILNADVNASAAIAYSKLALTGAILNADVSASAAIAYSKLALTGTIVNADVSASAAIAGTKISPDFGAQNIVTTGTITISSTSTLNGSVVLGSDSSDSVAFNGLLTTSILPSDSTKNLGSNSIPFNEGHIQTVGLANGSAAAPSLQFDNDVNTGLYLIAPGNAGFSIDGVKVLDIASTGFSITGVLNVSGVTTLATSLTGIAHLASGVLSASSIVNADISASAAIAYSKLSLTGAILNADLAGSIAFSKLATLTSANILVGSAGNVATAVAVTGDVTITNAGVTAIGTNKVTAAMSSQMAAHTFKGNNTASTANALDLTITQLTAEIAVMAGDAGAGGVKGLVPAQVAGDAVKYLNGAGTWSVPPGTGGLGDVTGPASATALSLAVFSGTTGKLLKNSTAEPYTLAGSLDLINYVGATAFIPSGSSVPTNGMYLSAANTVSFATNTTNRFNIDAAGLIGISGAASVSAIVAVGEAGTINTLTGVTQGAFRTAMAANSSATSFAGFATASTFGTAAASFTLASLFGFRSNAYALGAGSTITRAVGFGGVVPTTGTNNAYISDNLTFTGSYFINSTSTNASLLSGILTAASFIPSSSTIPTNGMYLSAANTLSFASNSTLRLSLTGTALFSTALTATNAAAQTILFSSTAANGGVNLRLEQPVGATTADNVITFVSDSGANAWGVGRDSSDSNKFKIAQRDGAFVGANEYFTMTVGGLITLSGTGDGTVGLSVSAANLVTIGNGTATQHALNTLLATNGSQVMTMTNGPAAATAGNAVGWIKISINGTARYIPFW